MFSIICFAVAEDLPNPSNLHRFNPKPAQLALMMTILHRERKVLAGGLGKAFPLEKVGPRQAMRHDMLRHEGTTCHFQKSPSAGTTDKHFLWLLRKEEKKTKTKSKQHPRGRADRKQGVSYRSNTALRQARGTQLPG